MRRPALQPTSDAATSDAADAATRRCSDSRRPRDSAATDSAATDSARDAATSNAASSDSARSASSELEHETATPQASSGQARLRRAHVDTDTPADAGSRFRTMARGWDWASVVADVLADKPAVGRLLEQSEVERDGDCLVLRFSELRVLDRRLLETPATERYLLDALSRYEGPSSVRFEVGDASTPPSRTADATTRRQARVDELPPIGRQAVDLFGVEHIEEESEG